jgi:hypothetical protein
VSTILKALKRLETEQASLPAHGRTGADSFHPRKTLRRWFTFSLMRSRLVALAIVAFIAVVGMIIAFGWFPLQFQSGGDAIREPMERRVQADRSTADAGRTPQTQRAPATRPRTDPNPPVAERERPGRSASPTPKVSAHVVQRPDRFREGPAVHASKMPVRTAKTPVSAWEAVGPATEKSSTRPPQPVIPPKETTAPNGPSGRSDETDEPYTDAQRLTDGRLKVQAIAWAPEPTERMAVVNNKIVREGGTLDDFFIVRIGRETLYVRENGRLFKVLFGRP